MCNFKHLPRINQGHYWAPPRAAWCAHWSTGNVSHSPIQWGCVVQCALIQADTILIPLLIYNFFIHYKSHLTKYVFDHIVRSKLKESILVGLGKPSFKKYRNFMKYFHKTETPPPRTALMKSLFRFPHWFWVIYSRSFKVTPTAPRGGGTQLYEGAHTTGAIHAFVVNQANVAIMGFLLL